MTDLVMRFKALSYERSNSKERCSSCAITHAQQTFKKS